MQYKTDVSKSNDRYHAKLMVSESNAGYDTNRWQVNAMRDTNGEVHWMGAGHTCYPWISLEEM